MEFKSWYPNEFKLVLGNTLTEEQVDQFLKKPGSSPRFVYGMLMLPTVLKHFISTDKGSDVQESMTQATLFGYKLYQLDGSNAPVIVRSSDTRASVEGILILDLDDEQRNSIYQLEGGLMKLVSLQVEILCQKNSDGHRNLKSIDAGTFAWTDDKLGLVPMKSSAWKIDAFLKSQFYQNIEQSENRRLLETPPPPPKHASITIPAPDISASDSPVLDIPIRRPGSNLNALRRRFQSRLENIMEDIEWPDS